MSRSSGRGQCQWSKMCLCIIVERQSSLTFKPTEFIAVQLFQAVLSINDDVAGRDIWNTDGWVLLQLVERRCLWSDHSGLAVQEFL